MTHYHQLGFVKFYYGGMYSSSVPDGRTWQVEIALPFSRSILFGLSRYEYGWRVEICWSK